MAQGSTYGGKGRGSKREEDRKKGRKEKTRKRGLVLGLLHCNAERLFNNSENGMNDKGKRQKKQTEIHLQKVKGHSVKKKKQ